MRPPRLHTPWGYPHSETSIAPGIVAYTTASHGGLWVDETRWKELRAVFPTFEPYAGDHWLEEDCDAALATLVWPQYFTPDQIFSAVMMVKMHDSITASVQDPNNPPYFDEPRRWLEGGSERAKHLIQVAEVFAETTKDQWQRGAVITKGDGFLVHFRRGDESRMTWMPGYPVHHWFSDEDLDEYDKRQPADVKEER